MRVLFIPALLFAAASAFAQLPSVSAVANAGDYSRDIAPGTLISIFGQNLARATRTDTAWPGAIDGTSLEVVDAGRTVAAPLYVVSPGQINAQMPFGIASATVQVRVRTAAGLSGAAQVTVIPSSPRLFTKDYSGTGEAIAVHADNSLIGARAPARPGEVIVLYLTGLGEVTPALAAGKAAGDGSANAPLNRVTADLRAQVGGREAKVLFAGLAPYFVALYQLNIQLPDGLAPGPNSIVISARQNASPAAVTIEVSSPWQVAGTSSIGTAGGTVAHGGLAVQVPAGMLAQTRDIGVYRRSRPVSGNDRYVASEPLTVTGLPSRLTAPITLSVELTRAPVGETFIAVQTESGAGDGVIYLDPEISGNRATVTVNPPPTPAATGRSASPSAANPPLYSSFTVWAVTGYYALKSPRKLFRLTYPAEDLVEGSAEQIALALEEAYDKIQSYGLDWGRRNGAASWPVDVSLEYFTGDRAQRWGEEGSTWLGVQRQGINLNANFTRDRDNIEQMRITAGHELFHIMQNLYDPADAPSTWLWMEEAISTWFERKMAKSASYIPSTVRPVSGGSNNFEFFTQHGLEYPPGNPGAVQEHGYGASLFIEFLAQRYGDKVVGDLIKKMAARAPGWTDRSLHSPVEAVESVMLVENAWIQFCELFMTGHVYGSSIDFPALNPELLGMPSGRHRWTNPSDNGPTWTETLPDLSAKVFLVDIQDPKWPAATTLNITVSDPNAKAVAIVYKYSLAGSSIRYQRLSLVRDSYRISNAEQMIAAGEKLLIMLVNPRAVRPYQGRSDVTLKVTRDNTTPLLARMQQTRQVVVLLEGAHTCLNESNAEFDCSSNAFGMGNVWSAGHLGGTLPANHLADLVWSGSSFAGVSKADCRVTNFPCEIRVEGSIDAASGTLTNLSVRMKLRTGSFDEDGAAIIRGPIPIVLEKAYTPDRPVAQVRGAPVAARIATWQYSSTWTNGRLSYRYVRTDWNDSKRPPVLTVRFY